METWCKDFIGNSEICLQNYVSYIDVIDATLLVVVF